MRVYRIPSMIFSWSMDCRSLALSRSLLRRCKARICQPVTVTKHHTTWRLLRLYFSQFLRTLLPLCFNHVRFKVLTATSMKMTAFWDTVPYSLAEVDRCFRGVYCLHYQGTSMMEAVRTSETSFYFSETTRLRIPECCHLYFVMSKKECRR
jgi:hypothetical protein